MQENLKVGIITANFNNGDEFKDCLAGILSQSYKPSNMVLIDDASTDDSWVKILDAFSKALDV